MLLRQIRVSRGKGLSVFRSEIRRHPHPNEYNLAPVVFELSDDTIQIGGRSLRRYSTQTIVGAQFDNNHRRMLVANSGDPVESLGRRIATHSGVDDTIAISGRIQF